jgi:hypothetical protein
MQTNGQKLGCLRNQINSMIQEDGYRSDMRVILEDGREVSGVEIQRDKHGLIVAVVKAL